VIAVPDDDEARAADHAVAVRAVPDNVKLLTEMTTIRHKDIRSFLSGRLSPERTQELHDQLLAAGVPL
jgi:hypothetical protein